MSDNSKNSDNTTEARCDFALSSGLHTLPIPTLDVNFEDRIHAALAASPPIWHLQLETLWDALRPALKPALATLVVTLLLVQLSQLGLKHSVAGARLPAISASYLRKQSSKEIRK